MGHLCHSTLPLKSHPPTLLNYLPPLQYDRELSEGGELYVVFFLLSKLAEDIADYQVIFNNRVTRCLDGWKEELMGSGKGGRGSLSL